MKHSFAFAAAVLALLAPLASQAKPAPSADPTIEFERYTLDNGIEVILHRDNSVPLVAVDLWYHVGAGDEVPGKSGFAHLFEHMLFQGAKHIGEDAHFDILKNVGASSINGTTSYDRTNYFEVVPSHQLETALWLESDRMGYLLPVLTQKSLDNQISVVRNERRRSYDNVPYGKSRFVLSHLLYPEGHPYRDLVIGKHEDLESASLEDVRAFYKKWYVPANATLVIAGDFETEAVKALVNKWFGSFPTTTRPERARVDTPPLKKTTREVVEDDFAKLRQLQYVWHAPAPFSEGEPELDILADALGAEGTGRLYKALVHDAQLAQSVYAYHYGGHHGGTFTIGITLKSDADLAEVERIAQAELEKVLSEPLGAEELARAITKREARFVWRLESLLSRAETLQRYNHYVGTPDYISEDLDRYRAATPASVLATAKQVLSAPRVELLTVPADQGGK